jgi:hypothetical protein
MLGKVFENLLEVKDRKSKGTYYTPREIVHYMCQQSLINYLYTEVNSKQENKTKEENIQMKLLGKPDLIQQSLIIEKDSNIISKEDIEKLIKYGDTTIENDNHVAMKGEENKTYSFKLPESIRKNAEIIDEALKNIRVCDPAIGSGAFPVGMMNEIIRARNVLTPYLSFREAESTKQSRTIYNFKRHAIQNCLYGVDIEPGAVEIAKLRLWLSLIVDEENIEQIKPLPNLDYKIMQGNSLISEFMGLDLDNDKQNNENARLFSTDESKEFYEKLKDKKNELLNQPNTNKKKALRKEIEDLIINIFELKLQKQKSDYFIKIKEIEEKWERHPVKEERESSIKIEKDILSRKTGFNLEEAEKRLRQYTSNQKIRPFFPWKLYFSEVFQEKDGFDVVIANPPYVSFGLRGVGKSDNSWANSLRRIYQNSAEYKLSIYAIFMDKGTQLLQSHGMLCYITPDSFLLGRYFSKLRRHILNTCKIIDILMFEKDFWGSGVVGRPVITILNRESLNDLRKNSIPSYKLYHSLNDFNKGIVKVFSYPQEYFNNISYNRFRLFFEKNQKLLVDKLQVGSKSLSKFVNFSSGLIGKKGKDKIISKEKRVASWHPGLLSGSEIKKYVVNYGGNFIHFDTKVLKSGFKDANYFEPKILLRQTGDSLVAAYDDNNLLCLNNIHVGNLKDKKYSLKYILALLNSTLINYYYRLISLETGRTMAQTDIETLELLPVKIPSSNIQNKIVYLVDQILFITKDKDYLENSQKQAKVHEYERQIDQTVYKLYGLTDGEIEIVENFHKKI